MENTKKCPYCGEVIATTARKCEYCGESLNSENVEEGIEVDVYCHGHVEKETPTVIPNAEINNPLELTVETELEEKRPGFFEYYFYDAFIRHIFDFGEISRKQFWMGMLVLLFLFIVGGIITAGFHESGLAAWFRYSILALFLIVTTLSQFPLISILIRRFHDCGWSGWNLLLLPLSVLILTCKGKTKCAHVKHNKIDFIIWGIIAFLLFVSIVAGNNKNSYSGENPVLVPAVREEINQSVNSSDTNDDKITIATYTDKVHQYKYSLKKDKYDQFENVLYQRIIDTGENFEFNLEDFNCGDNQVMINSISDYAVKDEKIVIIGSYDGTGMFAGYYVIFLDMSDETLNYVDFGHDAEFINNKTQIKVSHLTLTKEGDCEAENEYSTEETIYNL